MEAGSWKLEVRNKINFGFWILDYQDKIQDQRDLRFEEE